VFTSERIKAVLVSARKLVVDLLMLPLQLIGAIFGCLGLFVLVPLALVLFQVVLSLCELAEALYQAAKLFYGVICVAIKWLHPKERKRLREEAAVWRQQYERRQKEWTQKYDHYRPSRSRTYKRSRPVQAQRSERGVEYDRYMDSEAWREKAEEAKKRAGYRCQLCNKGNTVLHVHHRTYERLGEELPEDLIVLCAGCHSKFHDKLPKRRRRTAGRR